jgi:hypothetical protein
MRSKIVIAALVVVAVVGIGVGVAVWAARSTSNVQPAPPTVADNTNPQPQPVHPALPQHTYVPPQEIKPSPTNLVTNTLTQTQFTVITNVLAATTNNDWEEKIDDIVGGDDPDTNKVAKLYALFPSLPPDGQEEAAQHLSNLVDDEDYKPLGEMLKNDKLPEGVLDELLADALNRPNNLKLPLLLAVASDANHAKHEEAKDLLELYLGDDYGTDWNTWGQHMTNWLQQNPE